MVAATTESAPIIGIGCAGRIVSVDLDPESRNQASEIASQALAHVSARTFAPRWIVTQTMLIPCKP